MTTTTSNPRTLNHRYSYVDLSALPNQPTLANPATIWQRQQLVDEIADTVLLTHVVSQRLDGLVYLTPLEIEQRGGKDMSKPTQAELDRLKQALQRSIDIEKRRLDDDVYAALTDSINDLHCYGILSYSQRVSAIDRLREIYGADEESLTARESYDDVTRGTFNAEGRVWS